MGGSTRRGCPELLTTHPNVPLVAISESQRRFFPDQRWIATIHHGLPLAEMPFRDRPGDYLAFVGRITPEKGIEDAIALSRATGIRLKVAAKVHLESEHQHFRDVVQPAIDDGAIDFLGELGPEERDPLYAGALATVMLGGWPEPFGLVAIESMATGTPVIARRAGALIETVIHGETGFIVDDVDEAVLAVERVGELDRTRIREDALARFSPARMTDQYEAAYRSVLADVRRQPLGRWNDHGPDPAAAEVDGLDALGPHGGRRRVGRASLARVARAADAWLRRRPRRRLAPAPAAAAPRRRDRTTPPTTSARPTTPGPTPHRRASSTSASRPPRASRSS